MTRGLTVELGAARALYPFESSWLEVPGGRLHYLDEGRRDAPVLLMLHGNPTWSFHFRELVRAFRGTHRVIVPDHLGCGLSDKPQDWTYTLEDHIRNVERLVESLGLTQLTLVVHDWGGAIGMGFAVRAPERVARLVILNTGAFVGPKMPLLIGLSRLPGLGSLAVRGLNAFVRGALLTCAVHKERLTPEVRAGYLAPYDSWDNRIATLRFVEDIPMSPSHPSRQCLEAIDHGLERLGSKPTLIVWGAKDFVFDDWFLEEWRRRFPAAEVHRVEDAGHFVVEDAGERLIAWMQTFLGRGAVS